MPYGDSCPRHMHALALENERHMGMKSWTEKEETEAVRVLENPIRIDAFDLLSAEQLTSAS